MKYELPKLAYAYDALKPVIDTRTMEIHHAKHHQNYTDKLNAVLEKNPAIADKPLEELLGSLDALGLNKTDTKALRNHGGGYLNHTLFWDVMSPDKQVDKDLVADIDRDFGSLTAFKEQFSEGAKTLFGSGWMWLAKDSEGKLHVHALPNQDTPLLHGDTPIFGLDVWEHAYYLHYQNRRPDYVDAWWKVLKLLP